MSIVGGSSEQGVGGNLQLLSGYSDSQSSGDTTLATADGSIHEKSSSGSLYISTGQSYDKASASGSIVIESGTNVLGQGGSISIKANDGAILDGGDVKLTAGGTHGLATKGGSMTIAAGEGSNDDAGNGGDGGTLFLSGGFANGRSLIDMGGSVNIRGGDCKCNNLIPWLCVV